MAFHAQTGIVTPVGAVTPDFIGQHYVDTSANLIYQAYGLTNTDWDQTLSATDTNIPVSAKSAAYTIVAADKGKLISCDASSAAFTLTLTAAATLGDGFWCYVQKADSSSNEITIDGNGSETINGATTRTLGTEFELELLVCDGTGWHLSIDQNTGGGGGGAASFAHLIDNLEISTSRSGSAETIALKTAAGTDPSGGDPISMGFRSPTAGSGAYSLFSVTAAASITISSGSTLGATSGTAFRLWLVAFNDASTLRLGVVKAGMADGIYPLQDNVLESATAEGGAGGADSEGVIFSGAAIASKAMRVIGYLEYTLTTAGTWDTAPSVIQIYSHGDRLPGVTVQERYNRETGYSAPAGNVPTDDSIPLNTDGAEVQTQSITPSSALNLLQIDHVGNYSNSANYAIAATLFQDSGAGLACGSNGGDGNRLGQVVIAYEMISGTTLATVFKVRAGAASGTLYINGAAAARKYGGAQGCTLRIKEIMV